MGIPAADGNVRAAMLLTAAWFALFALPLLVAGPSTAPVDDAPVGFFGAYRKLWGEVVGEWRRDRNVVYYLLASAVFRDGLAGVFAFGAVLGVNVYGISEANILLFGVCASVVADVDRHPEEAVHGRVVGREVVDFACWVTSAIRTGRGSWISGRSTPRPAGSSPIAAYSSGVSP